MPSKPALRHHESAHPLPLETAIETPVPEDESLSLMVAVHEAGHALAAWILDLDFVDVNIVPSEDSLGAIRYPLLKESEWDAAYAWRLMVMSLAGPAAEVLSYEFGGTSRAAWDDIRDYHWGTDEEGAYEAATHLLGDREALFESARLAALELIERNGYRLALLYKALLRYRRITRFHVNRVARRAGPGSGEPCDLSEIGPLCGVNKKRLKEEGIWA